MAFSSVNMTSQTGAGVGTSGQAETISSNDEANEQLALEELNIAKECEDGQVVVEDSRDQRNLHSKKHRR